MTRHRIEPAEALSQLGRIRLADTDLQGVLTRVAELAKDGIPGAAEVSVTLVHGRSAHTAAFTGAQAIDLDETQYEQGHGPCLDAARAQQTISVPDMQAEQRWPDYTPVAVERGALSSVSVGLPVHEKVMGALNIYATAPHALTESLPVAGDFAEYAAVALSNANLVSSNATLAQQLKDAMAARAEIEQAKGILIATRRCSPEEAFAYLSRLSQDSNRKLRDVARELVQNSAAPASSARRPAAR